MAILKFQVGEIARVTLDYEEPVYEPASGNFSEQYRYGVNGGDDTFYATKNLHTIIQTLGKTKGDSLEITKQNTTNDSGKTFQEFIVDGINMDKLNKGVTSSLPKAPASLSDDLFLDGEPPPTVKSDASFNEEIRLLQNDVAALKIWMKEKVAAIEKEMKDGKSELVDEDVPF